MAIYKSTPRTVSCDADTAFARISNVGALQQYLDLIPQEHRAKVGQVAFTDDAIVISAAPVGDITLRRGQCVEPSLVTFNAENCPVPMEISINIDPVDSASASVVASMNVDVPPMLAPFIGGKLQEAVDRMADLLAMLLGRN